jgi:hypothetical protein
MKLVECRRVSHTRMSLAYHLDPRQGMQRERFEHQHQEMLERLPRIFRIVENPLEMDRTGNQTRVVDRFMKNIPQVCGRRYGGIKLKQTELTKRLGVEETHGYGSLCCCVRPTGIHYSLEPIAQPRDLEGARRVP